MTDRLSICLPRVLEHEGGYVNHPADPGGPTMKGVTLAVYRAFKGKPTATADELRHISEGDLQAIYRINYWARARCDELPVGVDYCVFDYAVNSGVNRAVRHLQEVLGVFADGQVGAMTIAAANGRPVVQLIDEYCDRRMRFLRGLGTFGTFGRGWTARVSAVETRAREDVRRAE